jgi:hypothetical protein
MTQVATIRPQPPRQAFLQGKSFFAAPLVLTWATVLLIFASGGSAAEALLIAYAIIAAIMALSSSVAGLAMLVMVASIDGISKGVLPGWFTLLFKDAILWLLIFRWAANRMKGNKSEAARLSTTMILVVFVLWVLVETANVTTKSPIIALAGMRSWLGWVPVFVLAYDDVRTRKDILLLFVTMVFGAAAAGLYGAIQQHIGYEHLVAISSNFAYTARLGISGGVSRAMSTLPHPGMFGHYMATMMPMALALAMAPMLKGRTRLWCVISALFITLGAVASGGRTAAATLMVSTGVVILVARQAKMVVAGVVVLGILAFVITQVAAPESVDRMQTVFHGESTLARMLTPMSRGWQTAVENPFGVGVATGFAFGRAAALLGGGALGGGLGGGLGSEGSGLELDKSARGMVEGEFGRAFRELGFPGGFLLIYLVLHMLVKGFNALSRAKPDEWRYVGAGLYGVMVSGILGLFVGPALYLMPVAALFWMAFAGLLRLAEPEPEPVGEAVAAAPAAAAATAA